MKEQKHDPKVAIKVLNFFLKGRAQGTIFPEHQAMTPEEIKSIFHRAFIRLRAIYLLNKLSQEIIMYGTSSNLFDISTRDRPALQKYLFPLNKSTEHKDQSPQFPIIHPDSYVKFVWNLIFTAIILYTSIILPFRISFYVNKEESYWQQIDIVTDVLFWIDLWINMFSGYYDEEGKLVVQKRTVILKYLKGWFLLDFISCLPLTYMIDSSNSNDGQEIKLVKLAKLPRLYKLTGLVKLSKQFRITSNDFFQFNYGMTRLTSLFLSVILVIHLSSCVWHYVAAFNNYEVNSWVYQNDLSNSSIQTKYIAGMYYAFTTLTTVGYGDIHAYSPQEKIVTIILMILGVLFYSSIIGLLSSVLSQIDYKAHILNQKKAIMSEFCLEKKISRQLRDCLKETLEYNFSKNGFVWASDTKIFQDIPMNLRYEIMMSMHGGVFGHQALFQLVEDKAFVVNIVPLLKPLFMLESEVIWEEKSNPDAIYLIDIGRVNFKTNFIVQATTSQLKLFSFKSMISGSYFGEIEIFFHTTREYVVQCESNCEFYYLTLQAFENEIYDDFPHMMDKMRKIAEDRRKKNLETIEQLQKFILDETAKPEARISKKKKTILLKEYQSDSQSNINDITQRQNASKQSRSKHEAALLELRKRDLKQNNDHSKTVFQQRNPFSQKQIQINQNKQKLQELVLIAEEISDLLEE
ncbi:unnamed protein product (macronuclear) [Paramecium tetraurelia]|uniref:Cyclic nucleotide-binding domain-containing protein n=1 Tax=Paramecium tetraurelia TaxID=5888 RepID=A0EBR3_PARTE|nr:uncharacterized protein GSPATT00025464001 [Paramecium tetraurelia]CAK92730.1 unnamed protein product [Paramecium tetraurelia]|eukprot:XP_001460127.1 hypothetical protein (macronuclear) [Paramecium tetraurelia strain d4-2]